MVKRISITIVFLGMFLAGHLGVASFVEEGPYVEMEEPTANSFFMMDAEDGDFPLEGNVPSMQPCEGVITSGFGWRRVSRRRGRLHKGLDIAAPRGSPIVASADGKVAFVGRKGGYGNTVILDHGGSLSTLYAHNSSTRVKEGDWVTRGQEISEVGTSGRSTGPHLHYEVRVNGVPINPKRFF
jgi:murein DD-endopeptidase MepM/ murein hydrolase activator NlpD